jgi:gliding motility-associated-like protein
MLINPAVTSLDKPLVTFTDASSGHVNVIWEMGDGSSSSANEFVYQYRDTGLYTVQITAFTDKGCTDVAYGQVKIRPPFSVYIPNTFTPNENGLNEVFKVVGDGIVEIDYDIFDRWGNSIWSSYGKINAGWDGRLNGEPVPVGVYVYKIVVRSLENKFVTYHGQINLIR